MVLSGFLVAGMRAAGKLKSFSVQQFFKNAAEVWASSPHLRSKLFCNKFSLLQLHFLKLSNSQLDCLCETSCKFGQGNGAIAARWQAKAGVEPPFAGYERPLFLREVAPALSGLFYDFIFTQLAVCTNWLRYNFA